MKSLDDVVVEDSDNGTVYVYLYTEAGERICEELRQWEATPDAVWLAMVRVVAAVNAANLDDAGGTIA